MRRNQMRAILVMTLLLIGWYFWFAPSPTVVQPPQEETATTAPAAADQPEGEAATVAETPSPKPGADFLPPAADYPEDYDPAEDEVAIGDDYLQLVFTKVGGRLKRASILLGDGGENTIQLVPEFGEEAGVPDSGFPYPFGLDFTDESIGTQLNARRFDASVGPDKHSVTFSLRVPGHFELRKRFVLEGDPHVVRAEITYTNLGDAPETVGLDATPAYTFGWGPDVKSQDRGYGSRETLIWHPKETEETGTRLLKDLPADGETFRVAQVDWFGYKSKYFLVAFKPEFDSANGWAEALSEPLAFRFGLTAPRFIAEPGAPVTNAFEVYVGPMELKSLALAWEGLPSALRFFSWPRIMDTFSKWLLSFLHWIHSNVWANYGVAIIVLTVVVRLVMLPLTLKSMKSMRKMQALGPELEKLKEKYGDDQQELSKAMMQLYRERGVNPVGGCLPMILQMPIFFSLYRMLWNAFELRGAPFLWVEDLSRPDRFLHTEFLRDVPVVGQYLEYINLLPILMAVTMVISMRVTPQAAVQNPQQKIIMNFMPIMFAVFCYPLAAGLNLYVLTSTILGIGQTALVRAGKRAELPEPVQKKPPAKKKARAKNVYTRAQEAKRQQKKEARREHAREERQRKIEQYKSGKRGNGEAKKGKSSKKSKKGRTN